MRQLILWFVLPTANASDPACANRNGKVELVQCKCVDTNVITTAELATHVCEGDAKSTNVVSACTANAKNGTANPCACGTDATVVAGKFCSEAVATGAELESCGTAPHKNDGSAVNANPCGCKDDTICPGNNYCIAGICQPADCAHTNAKTDAVKNGAATPAAIDPFDKCSCGKNNHACATGTYCGVDRLGWGVCYAGAKSDCANTTGGGTNDALCVCGDIVCIEASSKCYVDSGKGYCSLAACTPDTANAQSTACMCGTAFAAAGKFCLADNVVKDSKLCTEKLSGVEAATEACTCGIAAESAAVAIGTFCYKDASNAYKHRAESFACADRNKQTAATDAKTCLCKAKLEEGYKLCDGTNKYCDGTAALAAACSTTAGTACTTTNGTAAAACACGNGDKTCAATEYCLVAPDNSASCLAEANKKIVCVVGEKADDAQKKVCWCGDTECAIDNYCFSDLAATSPEAKCVSKKIGDALTARKKAILDAKKGPTKETCKSHCEKCTTKDDSDSNSAACIGQFISTMAAAMNSV